MNLLKRLRNWLSRKPRAYILENKYRVVPAFNLHGKDYYQFDSAFDMPTGRAMAAMTFFAELEMRADAAYLTKHTRACEILLSGKGGKIDLGALAVINNNLKERLNLAPFPDHIYKLASVSFFTKEESPYNYDYAYNAKKIKEWKEAPGTLDFFLKGPLKTLMPFLAQAGQVSATYFQTMDSVNDLHQKDLHSAISKAGPQKDTII